MKRPELTLTLYGKSDASSVREDRDTCLIVSHLFPDRVLVSCGSRPFRVVS